MLHISAVKSSLIIYSQYSINQIIAESFMNNATTDLTHILDLNLAYLRTIANRFIDYSKILSCL